MEVYINGKYYSKEEAKVSVFDHGFLYGDGVFEGIRVYGGKVFKLNEHLKRLYDSAKHIMLEIPLAQEKMFQEVLDVVKRNKIPDAYIRLIVTRGFGPLGINPFQCQKPQIIIIVDKIQLYHEEVYQKGLELITATVLRTPAESLSPQIKSLNYLNNILARIEAVHANVSEAIMLNQKGYVTECTGDNIFMVQKDRILTPSVASGILVGVTRGCVIDIARKLGYNVSETELTRHDLYAADEVFLTGTAAEVVPVIKIDGRLVGKGRPGLVTLKLIKEFKALTKKEGTGALV